MPILPKQPGKLPLLFFSFQLCLGWFTGVAKAHVTGMLFILNQEAEIQSGSPTRLEWDEVQWYTRASG